MTEKPLTFEELEKVNIEEVSNIFRKVSQFTHDINKLPIENIGIVISYNDQIIFQQETKDGLIITKEVRFYKSK